jgi:hypothetical protein
VTAPIVSKSRQSPAANLICYSPIQMVTRSVSLVEGDMRNIPVAVDCLALGLPVDWEFRNEGATLCSYLVTLARFDV